MELNKIQQKIYDEYSTFGSVWADCPRQAGKTKLLVKIACENIRNNKKVFIKTFSQNNLTRIKHNIIDELKNNNRKMSDGLCENLVDNEHSADIILYDEIYFDPFQIHTNAKIVCLRTPMHKTLRFSYLDLEEDKIDRILDLTHSMTKEQWDIEFNS